MPNFTFPRSIVGEERFRRLFGSTDGDERFQRHLKAERHVLLHERMRLLFTVGVAVYLLFWGLDLVVARRHAVEFLMLRLGVAAGAAVSLLLIRTKVGEREIMAISLVWMSMSTLAIAIMSTRLGGFNSDYYAGTMVTMFATALFMPWRPQAMSVFSLGSLISYVGLNSLEYGISFAAVQPSVFIAGTGFFCVIASHLGEVRRGLDLKQRLQLFDANEELKHLDEAKTRFFANVNHELRTPLMLIMGPLDTIISGEQGEDGPQLLQSMRTNANRLLRQVNMILDAAKSEAGKLSLEMGIGNISHVLKGLLDAATPYAKKKNIRLEFEAPEDFPDSTFDFEKIETIAANLLSNALKFTPDHRLINVRVNFDKEKIFFEVEDTGPGIPKEQVHLVFDRFYQGSGKLNRDKEGSGLGLALARAFAQLHGGEISVESEVGRGSKFKVYVKREPVAHSEQREGGYKAEYKPAVLHKETALATAYTNHGVKASLLSDLDSGDLKINSYEELNKNVAADAPHVLIADDNSDMRGFIARSLAGKYRISVAEDGAVALAIARKKTPDLIVSDVMMPNMDGFELTGHLSRDSVLQRVPVILLTAKSGTEAILEGLSNGAVDYITKPFEVRELKARIDAHLRFKDIEATLSERDSRLAAIGHMTSAMAHDIRTPLSVIMSYTDLLLMSAREKQEDEAEEDLLEVKKSAKRVERMVKEVVDYARGGISLDLKNHDLPAFLDEVGTELDACVIGQGIQFLKELPEALALEFDGDRMHRVLENLILNARDALVGSTPPSQATIWLRCFKDGEDAVIRVSDNGPGVPPELQKTLFSPFVTHGKKHGTGLGLAIVRNMITAHGGSIQLESPCRDGGAAFEIRLPRVQRTIEISSYKATRINKASD